MNETILPEEDANNLKCSICSGYLSIAPIMISTDGKRHQCGRCNYSNPEISVRNMPYENLAKFMKFPCIYENCKSNILWKNVKEHELLCPHRQIKCPEMSCDKTVETTKVIEHFEEYHTHSNITKLGALMYKLINPNSSFLGLVVQDGLPFFCLIHNDGETFKVTIYSILNSPNKKFELIVYSSSGRKISVDKQNIIPFSDKDNCIDCYFKKCGSELHKNSNKDTKIEMTTELEVEAIRTILKSDMVFCQVLVHTDISVAISNNNVLRKTIECPICKDYMSPPIFSCKTGHTICRKCKVKLPKCASCESAFVNTRNFAVEELAEIIKIPCENYSKGCEYVGNSKELMVHEENCYMLKDKEENSCRNIKRTFSEYKERLTRRDLNMQGSLIKSPK